MRNQVHCPISKHVRLFYTELGVGTRVAFTESREDQELMNPRNLFRIGVSWAIVALLGITLLRSSAAAPEGHAEDEKAIRAVDDTYTREYNKADIKGLAALFTKDAEIVESDGVRYQGRELVEKSFAETFEASKGSKIELRIDAIRFLSPDVAKEDGRSLVTPPKGAPVSRFYTVLFVKQDGHWLISSVHEEDDPAVRPHDRLIDLEWMIGEWVEERSDATVRLTCKWSEDENYLLRSVTVKHQGKAGTTISQRIGWDPLAGRIRSWEFDSEGGFGEGTWSRDGAHWVVKHTSVEPDGTTASATNILSRERPDMIHWVSTSRVLGEESIPGEEDYVLARVPPAPRLTPTPATTTSPTSNTTRSPR